MNSQDLSPNPELAINVVEKPGKKGIETVPVNQVVRIKAPDGENDEIICYGDAEKIENATVSKAIIVPEHIAGFLDPAIPQERGHVKKVVSAILATIMGGGAIGATIVGSGCNADNNWSNTDTHQTKKNLNSATDYDHLQDQGVTCFSQPGDGPLSVGELPNGDAIILFTRDASGVQHCFGVTAPSYMDAATQECVAQDISSSIDGIVTPGGNPPIITCTADGTRIAALRGGEVVLGDLAVNGGIIEFQNEYLDGAVQGSSRLNFIRDGGQQYLLTNQGGVVHKHNLDTQQEDITTVIDDCDLPDKDDIANIWMGARNNSGNCLLITAPDLPSLQSNLDMILPGDYIGPRTGGAVFFFNAPDGNHYALVTEYCGDGTCDATETNATCPADCLPTPVCGDGNIDAGEVCDDNNTIDGDGCSANCMSDETCGNNVTDAITGEVCDDGNTVDGDGCSADCMSDETCGNGTCDTNETNATCPTDCPPDPCGDGTCDTPTENYNNCATDCEGECGDGVCDPTETNATCATDCDPEPVCGDNTCETPETNATCPADCALDPACQPFIDDSRITFTQGAENCELTDCTDTLLEELLTVQGECTFEIDFGNTNSVEVTIAAANGSADGAYKIDFIEQMGEMLSGQYSIDDNGNDLGSDYTKNGNTVATVVEGTQYSGEEMTIPENGHDAYRLECGEGQISVHKNGELIATLNAGESLTVDMEESGTDPDAGVDGGTDGGADAGTTPPGKPSCSEGCNSSKDKLPATELAFIGLLLLALARRMRRQREASIMENAQRVPGNILYSHVKSRIAKTLERLRG
jgi:cysteine-rich repeat protein